MTQQTGRHATAVTREYYDGAAAALYHTLWRENIHMGTWDRPGLTLQDAMDRTNDVMVARAAIEEGARVLDAGCGFGKASRLMAERYGARVTGISVGERELATARERADAAGLSNRVDYRFGDYHALEFEDESFDVVFSQDAFIHGTDKPRILREACRVLKPGGRLVFSDVLIGKDVPPDVREHVHERVSAPTIWTAAEYARGLRGAGFRVLENEDWTWKVARTYAALASELRARRADVASATDTAFVEKTIAGYAFSAEAAERGHLGQSFFIAGKPA